MLDVYQIAQNLSDINPTQLIKSILGRADIQKLMIRLNTENQLEKKNETPFGVKLYTIGGKYSVGYARKKNTSRKKIDLKDTGRYYQTFKVVPLGNGNAQITSDNKIHGDKTALAQERWGEVEGLNEENTKIVLKAIEEEVFKIILQ